MRMDTLAKHCGAVVDNAAESEVMETHEIEMKFFEDKGRSDLTEVYGVLRKCIAHMDPFHCCQLAIQHCSEKGLGMTDKGNSRQVHHRQAMQTLYDIIIYDKAMAQVICDEVLEEYSDELKYTIKAMREQMQRWLTNGRNAKHILEGYDLDVIEANFWVLWSRHYLELVTGWKKIALEEIIQFFLMDEVIVGLQFEAELVGYFEVTYQWHAYPGELSDRPGFRTMELHYLLFDFIMSFWESAVETPAQRFPKTYERIKKMEADGEPKEDDSEEVLEKKAKLKAKGELKRAQIAYGIQAGHDEIYKLYQRMLKAPMIFLAILDPIKGPTIVRAILALVDEAEVNINRADTTYDNGVGYGVIVDRELEWGSFKYVDEEQRPDEERVWYDWLAEDKEMIAHWFQQLGWCRAVVLTELKNLSREIEPDLRRPAESSTRLRDFFKVYPIIFTSLRAVYALLPSTSHIVESTHGMMRECYDPQVPIEFTNAKMRYKTTAVDPNRSYDVTRR